MIVQWLNETIESYFEVGPQNRVFLFFDPSCDYSRIIEHLSGNFELIKAEGSLLKLKYQIEIAEPDKNFVIYLPFQNKPDKVSYLKEYTYTGKVFSDTLYIFLKKRNVKFPTETRKISEIKKSLPALALESIGKSDEYWDNVFDRSGAELVLPDFREKLLQFFESPEKTYQTLKDENKVDAFNKKMMAEYGFQDDLANPEQYRYNFFRQLCFTEVYHTLNNPSPYPFKEFVSIEDRIGNNIKLIQDIRLHNHYRETYYDLISQLDKIYKIKNFARTHPLNPDIETFNAFDIEALNTLNDLAGKCQTMTDFTDLIFNNRDLIKKKSSGFWGKEGDIGEWSLLLTQSSMIELIREFKKELPNISDEQVLINRYCDKYYEIDQLYRQYITDSNEIDDSIENIYAWIEKFYIGYLDDLNSLFSQKVFEKEKWELQDMLFQGDFFNKLDLKDNPRTGIIIVDGLRFELGKEIVQRISNDFDTNIDPMYAQIPTDTVVGMATLLSPEKYEFDCDSKGIMITSDETPMNNKPQRISYLKSKVGKISEFNITDFNDKTTKELRKIKYPVVIFSGDPDRLGEAGGIDYLQLISQRLSSITKAIKKLFKANYLEIHVVADHGFLTFKDPENKFRISDKPGFIKDSRRFACGENLDNESLVKFNIPGTNNALYFPRSIYYFKKDSFLHGGISIQETIIPYITIKPKKDAINKIDIHVEMDAGISNRIFEVKIKQKWTGLEGKPRTVEVLAYYDDELISTRPACEIGSKEESLMVRILPAKYIPKGDKIKVIARDQETREILYETEKDALVTFEKEDF